MCNEKQEGKQMAISFQAIGQKQVSFAAAETAKAGKVCKLSGNGTVDVCAAGENFCGLITDVRGGVAAVSMAGYVELSYSGTAPTVGYNTLAADGKGGVKVVTTGGRSLLVAAVDSTNSVAGVFL